MHLKNVILLIFFSQPLNGTIVAFNKSAVFLVLKGSTPFQGVIFIYGAILMKFAQHNIM